MLSAGEVATWHSPRPALHPHFYHLLQALIDLDKYRSDERSLLEPISNCLPSCHGTRPEGISNMLQTVSANEA
jgi:hypothetical protein